MNEENTKFEYYSSVDAVDVEWLWYPYIPYGKITILQGDPGEGKSTFALHLAALVTKGQDLPDGTKIDGAKTVIYQCAEDALNDTIKPRLVQAGADCNRVAYVVEDQDGEKLTLDDERFNNAIQETGARLLIIDPIQAFIEQDGDMQSAVKMRGILRRLSEIAKNNNCAVLIIGHMTKGSPGKNLYRGMGSIDIAAQARSVLMLSRDTESPWIRYMYQIKSNLAPEGDAIGFVFDRKYGFQWIGKCKMSTETQETLEVFASNKKDRAKEYLKLMLSAQDVLSTSIYERMEKMGISQRTVREAKKELDIKVCKKGNAWYWKRLEE